MPEVLQPEGVTIDMSEGTIRVSSSYAMKVGQPNYSSEDAHTSMSLEVPLPADVNDAASLARALAEVHSMLADGAKLATFNELNQGFYTDEAGVLRPAIFGTSEVPVAASPPVPVPTAPAESIAVAPAAAVQATPVVPSAVPPAAVSGQVYADFGEGAQAYWDNREKKASGAWKPNASDFTSVVVVANGKKHSVWILGPQGNPNSATAASMQEYGIT